MPRPIDRDALLAFLDRKVEERGRADTSGLVITSVYSGLANRIRSGEFDVREGEHDRSCLCAHLYHSECHERCRRVPTDPGFEHHEPHCHLQHGLGGQCTCR